jgi:Zn-dependent protease
VNLPLFGWAKPTPVDASRFTRSISARKGSMWVALAGPASNFVLACVCGLVMVALVRAPLSQAQAEPLIDMCLRMVFINVGLSVFNLLPLHPLDGQTVMAGLLPYHTAQRFDAFSAQYGTLLLWAVVLLGRPLLSVPIVYIAQGVLRVVSMLA